VRSASNDTCGFEKDGFYFCQSQWTEKPMVHVLPHWNLKGREGDVIPVLCYTNCDTVELFVNGKSFGVQGYWFPCTTSDLHLTWTAPYQPGTLKAVGTKDGKVVITEEIVTTGAPAADNEVTFAIQGEGKIIGVDNGNPGSDAIDRQSGPDSTNRDFARAQVKQCHHRYF
jgi:beta-galactosidase